MCVLPGSGRVKAMRLGPLGEITAAEMFLLPRRGVLVVVMAVVTVVPESVPEAGRELGCRSSIRPPGGGMVIYGRGRMGSIRAATAPPVGGDRTSARPRIRSRRACSRRGLGPLEGADASIA
jgi:hypothetical protein